MALFNQQVQDQLRKILTELKDPVHLVYFTQEFECGSCAEGRQFVEEISALSDQINFEVFEFVQDGEKAKAYGVERIPAIVVLDKDRKDHGIRFFGVPGGYEINSFLAALKEVSGAGEKLPEELRQRIQAIDRDVHLQVFVTLTCPHCPGAVALAHRLALENEHITADMIDAAIFPDLSNRYQVMSVPKTVINETAELVGAQPLPNVLRELEAL